MLCLASCYFILLVHVLRSCAGSCGSNLYVTATAQDSLRAHKVSWQSFQRLAHCLALAGVPQYALPPGTIYFCRREQALECSLPYVTLLYTKSDFDRQPKANFMEESEDLHQQIFPA